MRKKEKEIKKRSEIEAIMEKALVCRIGFTDGSMPYVVPVNFGYRADTVYFHCALQGRKMDILRKNPNICFECDVDTEMVESDNACNWSMKYRSVIGFGTASIIDDLEGKRRALNIIMEKYAGRSSRFPENIINRTAVVKIEITTLTGKESGF